MFVIAAIGSSQSKKRIDPCTPRGYASEKEAWKVPPASLVEKNRYLPTLLPNGNFTECRSASLKLLQKDQGIFFMYFFLLVFYITHEFYT